MKILGNINNKSYSFLHVASEKWLLPRRQTVPVYFQSPIRCGKGQNCRCHNTALLVHSQRRPSRRMFAPLDRKLFRSDTRNENLEPNEYKIYK